MDKSTTGKKFEYDQMLDKFVNFGTQYIKNWTENELKHFIDKPIVIPVGNYGFFVGPFRVKGKSLYCWTVEQQDGKYVHDFVSKASAILYCLKSMKNIDGANQILELDRQLGRLDNDILFYKNTLAKTKNEFKSTIVLNRYIDAKLQRRSVLNILKKTLISAKYLNFGK